MSNLGGGHFDLQTILAQRSQVGENGYKVGISYKTKNAGKGQEKFVIKSLSSNISGDLNFFGKNDGSMNSWTLRELDY